MATTQEKKGSRKMSAELQPGKMQRMTDRIFRSGKVRSRLARMAEALLRNLWELRGGTTVRRPLLLVLSTSAGAVLLHCARSSNDPPFEVLKEYSHDSTAYTQGLVAAGEVLFESTGLYGGSELRKVDVRTGRILRSVTLPHDRFGEGLALLDHQLLQLTWQSQVAYVYDATTLARVDSFKYVGEGWGLASDGSRLVMSDGSATLRLLDPKSFARLGEITVRDGSKPIDRLNELEFYDGDVLANVYRTDSIVRISLANGKVRQWIDLSSLFPRSQRYPGMDVLNGIAVDVRSGHLLVTGKRWPKLFELRLSAPPRWRS